MILPHHAPLQTAKETSEKWSTMVHRDTRHRRRRLTVGRQSFDDLFIDILAIVPIWHRFSVENIRDLTKEDSPEKRIGEHGRVVKAVGEEVVRDLAQSGSLGIQNRFSAMQEVRRPDEDLPLLQ